MRHQAGAATRRLLDKFLLPLVIVAALAGPAWVSRQVDSRFLEVQCQGLKNQQEQLVALRQVAGELGLPGEITVRPLPKECR